MSQVLDEADDEPLALAQSIEPEKPQSPKLEEDEPEEPQDTEDDKPQIDDDDDPMEEDAPSSVSTSLVFCIGLKQPRSDLQHKMSVPELCRNFR